MDEKQELEVVDAKSNPLAQVSIDPMTAMVEAIERICANPDVDPAKMQQFLDVQERIMDKNASQAFNVAMCKVQKDMPIVPKDAYNGQTKSNYTSYETMLKWSKPIYTAHGFSTMFYEGETDKKDNIRLMVDVMHEDGHCKTRFLDVPMDMAGIKGTVNKTATHGKVSSVSYGKSTLMRMIFNIPTGQDDDGNAAGGSKQTEELINPEQEAEILDMLSKSKTDLDRMLAAYSVGMVADMTVKQYAHAMKTMGAVVGVGK